MKKENNELAVFKFNADYGRMGNLEGVFVAKKSHVKYLIDNKIQVYFGEVLGKHSEVYGELEEKDFKMVSEDKAVIDILLSNNLLSGYDPFDYTFVGDNWEHGIENTDDLTVGEAIAHVLDGEPLENN